MTPRKLRRQAGRGPEVLRTWNSELNNASPDNLSAPHPRTPPITARISANNWHNTQPPSSNSAKCTRIPHTSVTKHCSGLPSLPHSRDAEIIRTLKTVDTERNLGAQSIKGARARNIACGTQQRERSRKIAHAPGYTPGFILSPYHPPCPEKRTMYPCVTDPCAGAFATRRPQRKQQGLQAEFACPRKASVELCQGAPETPHKRASCVYTGVYRKGFRWARYKLRHYFQNTDRKNIISKSKVRIVE